MRSLQLKGKELRYQAQLPYLLVLTQPSVIPLRYHHLVVWNFLKLIQKDHLLAVARLRNEISKNSKKNIAVLISDTFGRPFRNGQTDCAIGVSGMPSILDYAGTKDKYGRTLRVTAIAVVDELCAAAELIKGKHDDCPAAIIRNFAYEQKDDSIKPLIRPAENDLFR